MGPGSSPNPSFRRKPESMNTALAIIASTCVHGSRVKPGMTMLVWRFRREAAVAAVAGQPAFGDGGARGLADPDRLQPLRPRRDDIVAPEHQPLVPGDRRPRQPAGRPG